MNDKIIGKIRFPNDKKRDGTSLKDEQMTHRYKVTLTGTKGFYRIYELKASSNLYRFHKRMKGDMDFPQDQMILFKAFNKTGAVSSRYSMFDLGAGTIDSVTIEETIDKGELSFTYFYDTTNKKSVNIEYLGECAEKPNALYPLLVDSLGPNPSEFENGYVAFEDLSDEKKKSITETGEDDDFDEDFDEEEDEDEDGYDEEDHYEE